MARNPLRDPMPYTSPISVCYNSPFTNEISHADDNNVQQMKSTVGEPRGRLLMESRPDIFHARSGANESFQNEVVPPIDNNNTGNWWYQAEPTVLPMYPRTQHFPSSSSIEQHPRYRK